MSQRPVFYAVPTKSDCPHVAAAVRALPDPTRFAMVQPCEACGDPSENWVCLQCHRILCSRCAVPRETRGSV